MPKGKKKYPACRDDVQCRHKGDCIVILDPSRLDCPKCGQLMERPPEDYQADFSDVEGLWFEVTKDDVKICHRCERQWIIDREPHDGLPPSGLAQKR